MPAKQVTVDAVDYAADVQEIAFTKAPGKPIQVTVTIGLTNGTRDAARFELTHGPAPADVLTNPEFSALVAALKKIRNAGYVALAFAPEP